MATNVNLSSCGGLGRFYPERVAEGAGWYVDPSGSTDTFRWWDGAAWTRWLSVDATAADPQPTINEAGSTAYAPPDPADRVVRLPAAAAILVGAVLLALIAVGAIITLTADRPLTGPAAAPPPRSEPPLAITYDAATRAASVEELRVVLPAEPFTCDGRSRQLPSVFDAAVTCLATVHPDYDDQRDWSASAGLGLLPEQPRTETELRERLATSAEAVLRNYYNLDDVTLKKAKNRPFPDVAPPGRARVVTAELHVSYQGLPTEFDAIRIAIFHLASGRYAVWWGLLPDDSPAPVRRALDAAAGSITARK